MKMLGLNPSEQEVVDIPNNIAKYETSHILSDHAAINLSFTGRV